MNGTSTVYESYSYEGNIEFQGSDISIITLQTGEQYELNLETGTVARFQINYLDKRQNIAIDLFDMKGTHVNTVVSRSIHQAGNHTVEFNVGHLSDGAYAIRLNGEEGILTKPIILSK